MKLGEQDLFFMVGAALRYAFGRKSMFPSYIQDFILDNNHEFTIDNLELYYRDVNQEIEWFENDLRSLGDPMDEKDWYVFRKKLKQVIDERKNSTD